MVQHSAAKFVCNTYPKKGQYENFSITRLIDNLQWDTLEDRRDRAKLCMAFKILNGAVIRDRPNRLSAGHIFSFLPNLTEPSKFGQTF